MSFSKTIPFFIFILISLTQCKKKDTAINPLVAPDDWREETIEFPLSFAPSLKHKGTEYVRFAPNWGKQDSEDFFSYVFLWDLKEDPKVSSSTLESEIETYFDGLMSLTAASNSDSEKNIPRAKAFFEKINNQSYAGKVITHDAFITKKEITLNVVVNTIPCKLLDTYLVIFRISPKPINHRVWAKLNNVQLGISCE